MVYFETKTRFRGKASKALSQRLEKIITSAESSAESSLKEGDFFQAYDGLKDVISDLKCLVN